MANKDNTSPKLIWEKLHNYVRHYDAEGQASLFAEDGVWELPFAPAGVPRRIEGKEQILAISKKGMERSKQSGRRITDYKNIIIHTTTDPSVIIVEFILQGETSGKAPYAIPYIQVMRVGNGKITSLKDYFPAEVLQSALQST